MTLPPPSDQEMGPPRPPRSKNLNSRALARAVRGRVIPARASTTTGPKRGRWLGSGFRASAIDPGKGLVPRRNAVDSQARGTSTAASHEERPAGCPARRRIWRRPTLGSVLVNLVGGVIALIAQRVARIAEVLADLVAGIADVIAEIVTIRLAESFLCPGLAFANNALGIVHDTYLRSGVAGGARALTV